MPPHSLPTALVSTEGLIKWLTYADVKIGLGSIWAAGHGVPTAVHLHGDAFKYLLRSRRDVQRNIETADVPNVDCLFWQAGKNNLRVLSSDKWTIQPKSASVSMKSAQKVRLTGGKGGGKGETSPGKVYLTVRWYVCAEGKRRLCV